KLGDSASQFFHRFAEYASGCATGLTYFGLSPKGDILPCAPATHVHLGNIIKDGLKNIWLNHPAFKILRNRHQTDGNCGECKDSPICGGCRVTAYGNTGSWLASDSSCPYPLLSK
ncbi:MAG: SPASM domain-containing protein, partial [Candidatus Hodarchaeota archaeon]